jgi:hypothetical protein
MVEVGDVVVFVDAIGHEHDALLTAVWRNSWENLELIRENHSDEVYQKCLAQYHTPSVNLVIISTDETKKDQYGRQIERHTSVVHRINQFTHGMYWKEKN